MASVHARLLGRNHVKRILILGGGLSGFYIARDLEKKLQDGEAQVTLVDMRSACVYQPFLAEVASGAFPTEEHTYKIKDDVLEKLY